MFLANQQCTFYDLTSCHLRCFTLEIGAPGRTQTSNQRVNLPTTALAAAQIVRLWSGLSLYHSILASGTSRQVSTPS